MGSSHIEIYTTNSAFFVPCEDFLETLSITLKRGNKVHS